MQRLGLSSSCVKESNDRITRNEMRLKNGKKTMFESFRKLVSAETTVEKAARLKKEHQEEERLEKRYLADAQWQSRLRTWQSQHVYDALAKPHELTTFEGNRLKSAHLRSF